MIDFSYKDLVRLNGDYYTHDFILVLVIFTLTQILLIPQQDLFGDGNYRVDWSVKVSQLLLSRDLDWSQLVEMNTKVNVGDFSYHARDLVYRFPVMQLFWIHP